MGRIADRMLYFVLADYGDRGHAFVETDIALNSLRQVIVDIATGEIAAPPLQILECNPVEHVCNDVTQDIAREVHARLADGGEGCPARLRDFLDENLIAGAADYLDRAAGTFDAAAASADDRYNRLVTDLATRVRQAAE
jgi:hypothetical protein